MATIKMRSAVLSSAYLERNSPQTSRFLAPSTVRRRKYFCLLRPLSPAHSPRPSSAAALWERVRAERETPLRWPGTHRSRHRREHPTTELAHSSRFANEKLMHPSMRVGKRENKLSAFYTPGI